MHNTFNSGNNSQQYKTLRYGYQVETRGRIQRDLNHGTKIHEIFINNFDFLDTSGILNYSKLLLFILLFSTWTWFCQY